MGRYQAMKYFDKELKIKKLKWLVIFDDIKSTDERRRLATSKIGPASGPCSLTATSEGSLATVALDGDDDGAPPLSSSSHPPVQAFIYCRPTSARRHRLPCRCFRLLHLHSVRCRRDWQMRTGEEDMDGAMTDCGGRGEKRAEAWWQRRGRQPFGSASTSIF